MACKRELPLTSPPGTDDVQQILKEVDGVKQKICSIKLDMASASVQRERAQIQIQLIDSECKSYSGYSEGLRREIEATSVEKEFIDLDRSEVEREIEQIKASHVTEAANFSERMEKTKSRLLLALSANYEMIDMSNFMYHILLIKDKVDYYVYFSSVPNE